MNTFFLKIMASDKVFYSGKCKTLIVPALDGELAIQAHHQNMVVATTVGEVQFTDGESDIWKRGVVGLGLVYIANNRVTMLVDTAENPEDIDEVRAREALERAQEQLRQKQSIQEYHVSQASMARAMYRLKNTSQWHEIR